LLPHGLQLLPSYFYVREFTNDSRICICNGLPPGDGMANFKLLIGASLLVAAFGSHAGYAQVSPPAAVVGATVKTGSSGLSWINNAVRFNGSLNIGGRAIVVPAAMRFASNAPRIIATAIAFNPYIRTALTVASLISMAQIEWDDVNSTWIKKEIVPGKAIFYADDPWNPVYSHGNAGSACQAYVQRWNAKKIKENADYGLPAWEPVSVTAVLIGGAWSCVGTSGIYDGATLMTPLFQEIDVAEQRKTPISNQEAIDKLAPFPIPNDLPNDLPPGIVIPVEPTPIINPVPDPQVNPLTRPLRQPLGEPVPVPNTDPQQWKTPVIDVIAAPLPDQPWRVDVQPKDILKNDPSPITDPAVSNVEPTGQTQQEKTPGLCDLYPDILACQKPNFDTPDIDQIETRDASITITPDSGWGAENATCPPARHLPGANVDFEFTTICNFMSGIRPVMIAVAWLMAAMILIGFKRGE